MWQFVTMWSILPAGVTHWIVNIMLIAGVAGVLASWIGRWIPFFDVYARLLKPLGIVLLLGGIYLKGGEANNDMWLARIADLEAKVKVSEQKSKEANTKLSTVVKEKNKAIQDNKYIVLGHIKQNAAKIDKECRLDSEAVKILNESAQDVKKAKK